MMQLPLQKSKIIRSLLRSLTVVYGTNKVGKTEFFSHMDNALWLCTEPGHDEVSIFKLVCHSHEDVLEAIGLGLQTDHRPFIIDAYEAWVMMVNDWVCRKYDISHVADLENNKGYYYVTQEIDRVLTKLLSYTGVIIICHDGEEKYNAPNETYYRRTIQTSGKNRSLILDKANYILAFKIIGEGDNERRIIQTRGSKYQVAGHRGNFLPPEIPMDYDEFMKHFKEEEK